MKKSPVDTIIIMGPSGSGKDRLVRALIANNPYGLHRVITTTSRPPRAYEQDKVDYNFVSQEDFSTMLHNNEIIEFRVFNDWYYGTNYNNFSNELINIIILDPRGALTYLSNIDMKIIGVYCLEVEDKTRLTRSLNREWEPDVEEVLRRYKADKIDFDPERYLTLINRQIRIKYLPNNTWEEQSDAMLVIQADIIKYLTLRCGILQGKLK